MVCGASCSAACFVVLVLFDDVLKDAAWVYDVLKDAAWVYGACISPDCAHLVTG